MVELGRCLLMCGWLIRKLLLLAPGGGYLSLCVLSNFLTIVFYCFIISSRMPSHGIPLPDSHRKKQLELPWSRFQLKWQNRYMFIACSSVEWEWMVFQMIFGRLGTDLESQVDPHTWRRVYWVSLIISVSIFHRSVWSGCTWPGKMKSWAPLAAVPIGPCHRARPPWSCPTWLSTFLLSPFSCSTPSSSDPTGGSLRPPLKSPSYPLLCSRAASASTPHL